MPRRSTLGVDFEQGAVPTLADHEVNRFSRHAADKLGKDEEEVKEVLRTVVGSSPIVEPYLGTDDQRQQLRTFTAGLIGTYSTALTLADDPEAHPLAIVPPYLRSQVDVLKELTWFYVIDNRALKTQQHGQRRVVRDLFKIYLDADVSDDADERGILPLSQQKQLERLAEEDIQQERVRIVADLISSMTEQQMLVTYRKLTGIELGSTTDLI